MSDMLLWTELMNLIAEWRMQRDAEREEAPRQAAREAELLEHSADTYDVCADALEEIVLKEVIAHERRSLDGKSEE
jgi:hypothetical protein